ncbi:MaoC/PaaZ C-terminal domain-containing protein [Hydrogenophaga palleronii]|uniref:MaoC/PaaZ C-terminal domain-containing protein n=1 Tax=Hydrogenophaga palleronii TaxID=65655 RepID=UPI000826594B|nr:MaoC/PaaZ C-terminal domain-containing protein [Hydrogenophaga palleronii]
MTIDYRHLKARCFPEVRSVCTPRDAILYALAIGVCEDPLEPQALAHVYEGAPGGLRVMPTQAAVLGYPGFWAREADAGIDWVRLVHGEQRLAIHQPLPVEGFLVGRNRISHIIDKGEGKGAVVAVERTLEDETGLRYATLSQVVFCRSDGGFSRLNGGQPSDEPLTPLQPVPAREPDHRHGQRTRPDAALLYRLLGDPNPLHADPVVAHAAGFERPILHGLATYGIACWAVLRACAAGDARRLLSFDARFAAPVYPGEALCTDVWEENAEIRFQTRVTDTGRERVVMSHGRAILAGG